MQITYLNSEIQKYYLNKLSKYKKKVRNKYKLVPDL